jgi:hypothetical protein
MVEVIPIQCEACGTMNTSAYSVAEARYEMAVHLLAWHERKGPVHFLTNFDGESGVWTEVNGSMSLEQMEQLVRFDGMIASINNA